MNILLLDDSPHRIKFFQNGLKQHQLTVSRHSKAAIKALKRQPFEVIFLDHDLNGRPTDPDNENTGSEVARFSVDHEIEYRCIILHTENRAGREAMEALLEDCFIIPYSKLKKTGFTSVLKLADTDHNTVT